MTERRSGQTANLSRTARCERRRRYPPVHWASQEQSVDDDVIFMGVVTADEARSRRKSQDEADARLAREAAQAQQRARAMEREERIAAGRAEDAARKRKLPTPDGKEFFCCTHCEAINRYVKATNVCNTFTCFRCDQVSIAWRKETRAASKARQHQKSQLAQAVATSAKAAAWEGETSLSKKKQPKKQQCTGGSRKSPLTDARLDTKDKHAHEFAGHTLGKLDERITQNVGGIAARIVDESHLVRKAALDALGKLGEHATTHIGAIAARLEDGSSLVRTAAIGALGRLGEHAASQVHAVAACIDDKDLQTREAAINALGKLGKHSASHVESIIACLGDDSMRVRKAVVSALGELGEHSLPHVDDIAARVEDKHCEVRDAAVQALGKVLERAVRVADIKADKNANEECAQGGKPAPLPPPPEPEAEAEAEATPEAEAAAPKHKPGQQTRQRAPKAPAYSGRGRPRGYKTARTRDRERRHELAAKLPRDARARFVKKGKAAINSNSARDKRERGMHGEERLPSTGAGKNDSVGGAPAQRAAQATKQTITATAALTYIHDVKNKFKDNIGIYYKFLKIMTQFKAQDITPQRLIKQVNELFADHEDLIQGFAAFVP